ncbi:2452_t:CDS:2 [Paraglomus brasilianum]|uniref:2452_t:CDS:1 n=1 Tax=Paraglomus brasilianum TaxID=144538 RepID=A0A9N8ZVI5_9GLOM|nr:2452_t:CDS:2 [Paraglomus brasilianum]
MTNWSPQEDEALIRLHKRLGSAWIAIARKIKTKNARECADRWRNTLSPGINSGPFTLFERQLIVYLHNIYGPRWSRIASQLPGRTSQKVKNCWYSMRRAEDTRIRNEAVRSIRQQMAITRLLN